jgi:LuxR family quorum sensing-dependent transcriptional regulator
MTTDDQSRSKLVSRLLHFTERVDEFESSDHVLNALHDSTHETCGLNVLGALLLPLRWGDIDAIEVGKTVFLHKSAPKGWWDEQLELTKINPGAGAMLARLAIAPYTMSETMQRFEPLGVDRWPFELALKYGMRDRLTCPVGGRWIVVYWSRYALTQRLAGETKALLLMAATFAAIRLQKLIAPNPNRLGKGVALTPRELAVLRLLSNGKRIRESAQLLGLGEETVRSHLKKAQAKLGVNDNAHAVAQAMRLHLIP